MKWKDIWLFKRQQRLNIQKHLAKIQHHHFNDGLKATEVCKLK